MTEFMIVRGTGETYGHNLPRAFMAPLLRTGDVVTEVDYPASIGPANAKPGTWAAGMTRSRRVGKANLAEAIRRTENVPVLVGYSLGGFVVSDLLEDLAAGKFPELQVAGAIQIASPRAPRVNGREGLARAHGRYPAGLPVCEIRNWRDMICNTPSDSPLMKLTGLVDLLTGGPADGMDVPAWILGELLRIGRVPTLTDYELIMGYANGPEHTGRYTSDPVFRARVRAWRESNRL
ncbi:lysin B [Gordonia phage Widow]|nr:lysin B [Gordonia phage Widow]